MAIGATKWLTTCLHYNEPWEELLTKAVKPYADVVLQTGVAEQFFFERSWLNGPHIKLWFKSTEFLLEKMLKPNLMEHFQQYFESKPSFLVPPTYPANFPEKQMWHPNNTVELADYHPDLERQGGSLEMSIFEKQYQASSTMVLNLLKNKAENWSQNERLSSAIKLNLGMLYGFSMSIDEAAEFANWAFQAWASQHYLPSAATASIDRGSDFQAVYEMQKNDILPYQSAIWELLKNYQKIEKPDFVDWIHVNTNANLELSLALDANKLRAISSNPTAPSSLWPFYADFLQKTNNRLGLLRQTEGYFLYAFAQNLKLMKKGTPQFSAQGINRAMPA